MRHTAGEMKTKLKVGDVILDTMFNRLVEVLRVTPFGKDDYRIRTSGPYDRLATFEGRTWKRVTDAEILLFKLTQ